MVVRRPRRLRLLAAPVLAALVVVALPSAWAEELVFRAREDGENVFFLVDGYAGENPTVPMTPGTNVSVVLINEGTYTHNIAFHDPIWLKYPCCIGPGMQVRFNLTVPPEAEGSMMYFCEVHEVRGMDGLASFVGTAGAPAVSPPPGTPAPPDGPTSPEGERDSAWPFFVVPTAFAVAALIARRRL